MKHSLNLEFNQVLQAGEHRFTATETALEFALAISADNGGASEVGLSPAVTYTSLIVDPNFVAGEAYGALVTIPLGYDLVITLNGPEEVSLKKTRY